MSKLSKLMHNPTLFLSDMLKKHASNLHAAQIQYQQLGASSGLSISDQNSSRIKTFLFGLSPWKQMMILGFPEREFFFIDKDISFEKFQTDWQSILLQSKNPEIMVWGVKFPEFLTAFVDQYKITLIYIEDGFIRSIDSGLTKAAPISLSIDYRAPYFDSNQASDLEELLASYDFAHQPDLIHRARSLMKLLISTGLSKYNHQKKIDSISDIYGPKHQKRVLVIGQVEDDASIIYGCAKKYTNKDLILIACQENPHAQVFYKPHPSVWSGQRPAQSNPKDLGRLCKIIHEDLPLSQALETIDHVYTITSQSGFEALQRNIKVTTLGMPFYSGWGLTDDRQSCPRRQRKLKIEELVAGVYLLYLQFFDPVTQQKTSAEAAIERLLQLRKERFDRSVQGVVKSFLIQRYYDSLNQIKKIQYSNIPLSLNQSVPAKILRTFLYSAQKNELSVTEEIIDPRQRAVFLQVKTLLERFEQTQAKSYLETAISEYPQSIELLSLLYDIQFKNSEYSAAAITAGNMIDLRPKDSQFYLKRAAARLRNGDFSGVVDSDFISAIDLSPFDQNILYRYFSYLWEKEPVSEGLFNKIDYALARVRPDQRQKKSYGKLLLLKASMLVEIDQHSTAYKLHREAKRLGTVDTNFFALRCAMRQFNAQYMSASEIEVAAYRKLLNLRSRFVELVLEANGAVCIVGNAPNLINLRLGSQIDKNKLVIRFNGYDTSHPYQQDYGVKTDIWVRMPFHPYVRRQPQKNLKLVIFTGSNRLYRPYTEWMSVIRYLNTGLPIQFFPADEFYELQKILGAPPTAGLMLCYMLYRIIGPLSPSHYYGLSFSDSPQSQSEYHYSDLNANPSSRHNWIKEADFFKTLILPPADIHVDDSQKINDAIKKISYQTVSENQEFDRVISISPGLSRYKLLGQSVSTVSGWKVEQHLRWLNDPATGEPSCLLLSILPTERVCILGFGRAKTGQLAVRLAKAMSVEYRLVEYGLISSMHLPKDKRFNFSLVLDDRGIFYDTTARSLIEKILLEDNGLFSFETSQRAQRLIDDIAEHCITKYNNSPNINIVNQKNNQHRILIVDQTAGDHSILYGQSDRFSFNDMLQHALEQTDAEVFLKIHPETTTGAKKGNFDLDSDLLAHPRLKIIQQQCNIVSLIKQVDEVYVMTSGVGLEALFMGKLVRCFGVPFYAGWGLTSDMVLVTNQRRPLTRTALFAGIFFKYHLFFHPETRDACEIETCIDWIIQHKLSLAYIDY